MPQYLNACGQMQAKPSSTLARRMRQKKVFGLLDSQGTLHQVPEALEQSEQP